jgi:hypothetical protein
MAYFLVKIRRVLEFENVYETDEQREAEGLAQMECNHHGEIVDEQILVDSVDAAEVVD